MRTVSGGRHLATKLLLLLLLLLPPSPGITTPRTGNHSPPRSSPIWSVLSNRGTGPIDLGSSMICAKRQPLSNGSLLRPEIHHHRTWAETLALVSRRPSY